jgi:uncharacterized protein YndB with AHSA1/START domain
LRLPIFIHASPAQVFRYVSDPAQLTRWFMDRASLTPRQGGEYAFTWEGGPTHSGKVLEFVTGKRVTLAWQWPGKEQLGTTKLRISLERKGGGTVVRFTHSGFQRSGPWLDLYEGAIRGWTYFMMNLKSVVEHGHDLRSPYDW